ncbi:MAG: 4-phosphoerythronate dehydrogenase [Chromatiales bacterium]|nr:4-phosphoerythronate dehydrogenase [Chromatiales bacterium]
MRDPMSLPVVVADQEIPAVSAAFDGVARLRLADGRGMDRSMLVNADALIVRSVTRVDAALVAGTALRFVATATAGTDHVDVDALADAGIAFASAPGANAAAAAEYTLAGLAALAVRAGRPLAGLRLGIVGCGHVGTALAQRARALGLVVACNDPPRAEREGPSGFVTLDEVAGMDAVCVHTPLTRSGPHATAGLLGADFIAALRPGTILCNAGRGGVLDEPALRARLALDDDLHVHLDVWAGEPLIDASLAHRVGFASPHVAGYSQEGRLRGTERVLDAYARNFGLRPTWRMADALPPVPDPIVVGAGGDAAIAAVLGQVAGLRRDTLELRAGLGGSEAERRAAFDGLRRNYPLRREWSAHRLLADTDDQAAYRRLLAAGFGTPTAS